MNEDNTRIFAWIAWIVSFGLLILWSQPSGRLVATLLVFALFYLAIRLFTKE